MTRAAPFVALLLALPLFASPASAQDDDDFFISLPAFGAIYVLDDQTLDLVPFATDLGIPFYGVWAADGFLYLPDRGLGLIARIDDQGNSTVFAGGGFLASPVTVVETPSGDLVASDIFAETVVRLDAFGNQTLIHDAVTSGGLIAGPGGLAVGADGTLYVSNNTTNTIAAIDELGNITIVSDGDGLLDQPGGIAVDQAGNLFVASYSFNSIVRIRLDTGQAEVFCDDAFMINPNDVKLWHKGGLLVTVRNGALVHIDALGQMSIIKHDPLFGEWDGVAVKNDHPPCSGEFVEYGTGLAGSGGFVPEMHGIFNPCIGRELAIEGRGFLGGTVGSLAWGVAPGAVPFKQGQLLVNPLLPWDLIPIAFSGAGDGNGRLVIPFTMPDVPAFVGASIYLQMLAADPGALAGVSMSNGLQEIIGS